MEQRFLPNLGCTNPDFLKKNIFNHSQRYTDIIHFNLKTQVYIIYKLFYSFLKNNDNNNDNRYTL